jgi:hypothetical protein
MKKYNFTVILNSGETLTPKGLYYQGKTLVVVGCEKSDHTVRRKLDSSEITDISITEIVN